MEYIIVVAILHSEFIIGFQSFDLNIYDMADSLIKDLMLMYSSSLCYTIFIIAAYLCDEFILINEIRRRRRRCFASAGGFLSTLFLLLPTKKKQKKLQLKIFIDHKDHLI